jgi:ssDNA-binding replication factor A large subunit
MTEVNFSDLIIKILAKVEENNRLLHEIKGFLDFKEPVDLKEVAKVIDDVSTAAAIATTAELAKAHGLIPHNQLFQYNDPKIADFTLGLSPVKFTAKIIERKNIGPVTYKDGTKGEVCNMMVSDGSAEINVCGFKERAKLIVKQNVGDIVMIEGWKVTEYQGKLQVLLGQHGKIQGKQETLE